VIVDSHIHLFAADQRRFPYAADAPYRPEALTLEAYCKFAAEAKLSHAVIVHPEPYQDDHRYLEYCLAHEPSPGFFKGTCLFDPVAAETPARMEALVKRNPGKIVALRIHETRAKGIAPLSPGPIKDRDLLHPAMKTTWKKAQSLGLAIQMHFVPCHAPQIGELVRQFPDVVVILDHLGRAGQGTAEEYPEVLKLASYPKVYMKYSGVAYCSKVKYPHRDVAPLVRRVYDAFGADRIIWGSCGHTLEEFERHAQMLEQMFQFAPASERARIRGGNAARLFRF
jgi:predicted TIM-barrel fold metal-dependent hydrolase